MLSLKVLGAVALFRDNVPQPWLERGWQRAALLAVLADGGVRGVPREVLAALLWPDSDDAEARHSLDVLLSKARRELGEKELFTGVATLRLNPEVISCDLHDFEGAIADGHLERAVRLRHGQFAAGLRVAASGELERRVEATRRRVDNRCLAALAELATRATRQGAHARAAGWWRLAFELDPLSITTTIGLIEALYANDEFHEALVVANAHSVLARESIGSVDERVTEWIRRLEAAPSRKKDHSPPPPPPPEDKRLALLTRLLGADYRVDSLIDDGTIAAVYAVHCLDGARREAHLLQPRVAAATEIATFERAFRKVMRLSHAGVVPVYDTRASVDGLVVICGVHPRPRFRDTVKRQRGLSITTALHIGTQLADVMRVAHQHECVHGDLRPKHVAIVSGDVILGNFGFAEVIAGRISADDSTVATLGSPRYQSPEQLSGKPHDEPADIYALGTMIFEMLAGHVPFEGDGRDALMKLRQPAPLLRTVRETVPAALEEIVARALARYPADRFSSMAEFHAALTTIAPPHPQGTVLRR